MYASGYTHGVKHTHPFTDCSSFLPYERQARSAVSTESFKCLLILGNVTFGLGARFLIGNIKFGAEV